MDLRVQKTLKNIYDNFLSLRKKHSLSKVKVSELCQKARINKSTFYRYYTDVFDLSDKLENEALAELMNDLGELEYSITEPARFIEAQLRAIQNHQDISILFRNRAGICAEKLEASIRKRNLLATSTLEDDMKLSFVAGGVAYVFLNRKYDFELTFNALMDLINTLN
ncbi:MAG: TetR/AcrR family transcriptional regulator [Gracilibacteraceae bacterium]|jgi:AcrR family transcriptional regulator|nr:TetR/AcrR family transcriptional regulator [Gracilibacteraceae bacterium]